MEEMFRWMLIIGLFAGTMVSMENKQYSISESAASNRGGETRSYCCNALSVRSCVTLCLFNKTQPPRVPDVACVELENEHLRPLLTVGSAKLPQRKICKLLGTANIDDTNPGDSHASGSLEESHRLCIAIDSRITSKRSRAKLDSKPWICTCNQSCCTVCQQGMSKVTLTPEEEEEEEEEEEKEKEKEKEEDSDDTAATTLADVKSLSTSPLSKSSSPSLPVITGETRSTSSIRTTHYMPNRIYGDQSPASATTSTSTSKSRGQFNVKKILLILLLLLTVAFIIVAVILIIRKRKHSGRSEVSTTRTNQNEAVSLGYETTVRENSYEPSVAGVPIYTELELTQQPAPSAPSNSTVYSTVQTTGEAVDMGKRVVYAELDKVAVVVSPIYSQPFESETSASNTEYAEPFKPDNKSTATAPVSNLYDNIAAVDQQNAYSLAEAIPLSDLNVIYSQPNKPAK